MPPTAPFRTDINALRAVAVLAVLLFHFQIPGISGGFVGVDVFYVISGYLMMQIITPKLTIHTFSFRSFYLARARRILPALAATVLATLGFGYLALIPTEYAQLGHHATTALTFASNFTFSRGEGYFAGNSGTQWLLHTWSLSVEWQFYLLFPLLLVATRRLKSGRYQTHILLGLFALSLILCMALTPPEQKASFYLLHTRAWELLAGALTCHLQHTRQSHRYQSLLGFAIIGLTALFLPRSVTYPGAWPLFPVLGTVLVLHARPSHQLLNNPLVQGMGTISYSLYLWHWPILVATLYLYGGLPLPVLMAAVALTFVAAIMSYHVIEKPFRTPRLARTNILAALTGYLLILGVAIAIWNLGGLPSRAPANIRENILANEALLNRWDYPRPCDNYKHDPAEKPVVYCTLGGPSPHKVLFWGDSHIEHLYPALQTLAAEAEKQHLQILLATSAGCPPTRFLNRTERRYHCDAFNNLVFARALQPDIHTIVLGAYWQTYIRENDMLMQTSPTLALHSPSQTLAALGPAMERDLNLLKTSGKALYLLQPVPSYNTPVSTAVAKRLWGWAHAPISLTQEEDTTTMHTFIQTLGTTTHVPVLDITARLCPGGLATCQYQQQGLSLYKDASHLSPSGAALMLHLLREVLPRPTTLKE